MAANYQHLRAFHAIAKEGSVTRAARRLNVAQPTLSQQLKALEERHGVQLFESRKSPLQLSLAGRDLFALTERLFAAAAEVDEMLDEGAGLMGGMLRLGSDSPGYAARLVQGFRRLHPQMGVQVRMANGRDVVRLLAEAEVDAALVSDPPGDDAFSYDPLYSDELWCALPAGHPLADRHEVSIIELSREVMLQRETSSKTRAFADRAMAAAAVEPASVIELQSRETIREGIALGLGVSIFFATECPPDRRIAYRPLDAATREFRLQSYFVCLRERRRSALMRSLRGVVSAIQAEQGGRLAPPQALN
ncbi:LysR substrate-binding domain-containing protein [Phenylobacterium montanum]|uniref:LysR family transcriptional regulator n=1 Tax=Phenylobacterium montanum TaxID=2823693 RepID=A0A975G1U2_9CAUL|nr:LysR substrate-binding domain-containing protein [Caulobacter sp. S6]QUD89166.1 LysR family transcriptional regulator [Caulobacter sp. S6]